MSTLVCFHAHPDDEALSTGGLMAKDNFGIGEDIIHGQWSSPTLASLADTPRIVQLNGGPEDNNATLFRDGYFETVGARVDAGDWELVADQAVPGWDNQQALTIMEQILVDIDNDVDAIFAANDGLANSAAVIRVGTTSDIIDILDLA